MKKLISLALISAMLLTFTACDNKEKPSDSSQDSTQTGQQTGNYEPISAPGSGWTMEELAKTICINGKAITYPLTIDSLGDDYSVSENSNLEYNGLAVALIRFDDESSEKDDRLKTIRLINVYDNGEYLNVLSINGVVIGSTLAEAEAALGKPTVETPSGESDSIWIYHENGKTEDDNFLVLNFSNGKVFMMTFNFR